MSGAGGGVDTEPFDPACGPPAGGGRGNQNCAHSAPEPRPAFRYNIPPEEAQHLTGRARSLANLARWPKGYHPAAAQGVGFHTAPQCKAKGCTKRVTSAHGFCPKHHRRQHPRTKREEATVALRQRWNERMAWSLQAAQPSQVPAELKRTDLWLEAAARCRGFAGAYLRGALLLAWDRYRAGDGQAWREVSRVLAEAPECITTRRLRAVVLRADGSLRI